MKFHTIDDQLRHPLKLTVIFMDVTTTFIKSIFALKHSVNDSHTFKKNCLVALD